MLNFDARNLSNRKPISVFLLDFMCIIGVAATATKANQNKIEMKRTKICI